MANSIRYFFRMKIVIARGIDEDLGCLFYVIPPPGGRYTPIPSDPNDPQRPLPMSERVESTACCSKKGLVNLTGSVPCLVTSPSRGTTLTLNIENLGKKPVTQISWSLGYKICRKFNPGRSNEYVTGYIHHIKGEYILPRAIEPFGGRTVTPITIEIRPNSAEHRKPNEEIKGYDRLGEYAWEKKFLTLPAQDYRKLDSSAQGEVSQIFMMNTYIEVKTDVHGCCSASLKVPIHWTTSAALDAAPVPLAPMDALSVPPAFNTEVRPPNPPPKELLTSAGATGFVPVGLPTGRMSTSDRLSHVQPGASSSTAYNAPTPASASSANPAPAPMAPMAPAVPSYVPPSGNDAYGSTAGAYGNPSGPSAYSADTAYGGAYGTQGGADLQYNPPATADDAFTYQYTPDTAYQPTNTDADGPPPLAYMYGQ
ncbi:hypothetical protein KIPB_001004 [Kipferlia bialata]|uniref:Uncharacterized protein n=1 Tax=Kipferlia bialata TaxID=797122 RepID=A0A9K3CRE9_9EUKA|nr:hypothetical protein KIPB_001004 [Kipferlia bialata]|eukprot:g1004.t1